MKSFAFLFAAWALMASAAFAAPPQGAPAAATMPCAQGAHMGMGPCPMMGQGAMGNMPCPAMGGGKMGPGHCVCPAMNSPRSGSADCQCPCPGMKTAAPAAVSKMGPAGSNSMVYGWQLMTAKERAAYRAKMRAAKTPEERAALRAENHRKMQERAKQQGVTLSEAPPAD